MTVTARFEDGELANVPAQALQMAQEAPVALAYDTEAVAAQILAFFDRARGTCPCQDYPGEKHDVNPPCARRREANLLAIELRPEVPRG